MVGGEHNKEGEETLFIIGRRAEAEGGDGPDRGGRTAPHAATMRPQCWLTVVLAVIMSYLSPERALGVPQREGERRRGSIKLSVMLEKG